MDLQTLTYIVVGLTFALYIGIAIWARAGTTKDFYVAGGGVNPVANGMATAADWMSAASFISMAGMIAFLGYGGSVFLMGWTGGFVLLAMLLAPYLRKFGKFTVPEFIGDRYYSKAARIVAVVCLIIASVTYVIGQMKGIGVAFSRFLEVDYGTGLLVGMGIVFVYAVMGGMKGITYTQIAQYCVLIFAYTIPAIFISLNLTGNPIPQLGLGSTMVGSDTFLLDRLDQVVTELGFHEYTTQSRLSQLNMFVYTMSLMIGTAGLPHVIIRFFTVPKVADARSSAGWALVFITILYTTAPAVAAMARMNFMNTIEPTKGEYLTYDERPQWFRNWEKTGLLEFQDKNGDGKVQYSANKDTNEMVTVDRDIMVLANPEIARLPNWVIALVAAGGLAAALSTAAGLLLAIASAISHDLCKGVFMPDISEKSELMASRIAMAGAIGVAGYLGFNPPDFAAGTVALAFGLAASSIFPALMMGIFNKRINKEGAIAGMIAGITVTLLYVFQHKGIMFVASTSFMGDLPQNWFLGIEPNAFGAIGAVVNFVVAFLVSRVTQEPPEHVQEMVESIRMPAGAGEAQAH
ncbi:MAG: cation acetate symporter [Pseudomonadales bacterium]|jgi:cation/acetate symporter|uniref:sodium:solute symporter family protein n=1 Tax=unclassified Ketobacter TaxID=2639109 RepID=UPI000C64AB6B|nr:MULTISPECIES: sodium:solute symporter family protein [unclassified Ketobacter]MAQ23188.1 cation acetate symporter [Pseudomonadales bacterium]MEC8811491.1 sodium:solute symporter family protein [Pseudomonadota bacterium]TNC87800.1 MAG: cation acetate symporter [Alcanivorax sp.]HAU15935.1 cation acetate symporter [Gammaproteobacteria bacterium]MBI27763.1 cation acetate symporter [Pseudomonadales bacterium]|tara:strand:- start:3872 stop:5602 length:1731 start_codon:yes stop_codon:yes gene_type:complete